MVKVDLSSPAMVTGATGYVAGHIVKRLLEEGATVHAAVRDPSDEEKLKHLTAIAENSPGEIRFFRSDLLKKGSYGEAMEGCSVVFHTASPYKLRVKDPQVELVEPALLGTSNVLEEANRRESVKRVVLTSSCVAIYGNNDDLLKVPNGIFTEEVWNSSSSLTSSPYSYSKALAEKRAWEIANEQSRWKLVALNPAMVLGPQINPHADSESFRIVKSIGDGTMRIGAPHLEFGVVDVRDLADAHLAAAYTPEAEGRYILSASVSSLFEMAQILQKRFGKSYSFPKWELPKWLVSLVAPLLDSSIKRDFIAHNVGFPFRADNSKGIRELGIAYRPLEETLNEMFQQMVDAGFFRKRQ